MGARRPRWRRSRPGRRPPRPASGRWARARTGTLSGRRNRPPRKDRRRGLRGPPVRSLSTVLREERPRANSYPARRRCRNASADSSRSSLPRLRFSPAPNQTAYSIGRRRSTRRPPARPAVRLSACRRSGSCRARRPRADRSSPSTCHPLRLLPWRCARPFARARCLQARSIPKSDSACRAAAPCGLRRSG